MKKYFIIPFLIFSLSSKSQTVSADTTKKDFRNVIGIDVTSLVRQFFISGGSSILNTNYPTIISYRRIIKSNALKAAVGGYIITDDKTSNDSLGTKSNRSAYNIRLGFEHYCYLGKRWMYYFGADLLVGHSTLNSETHVSTISSSKSKTGTTAYGISPVLGIVFKINDRLSIASESSFDLVYEQVLNTTSAFPNTSVNSESHNDRISSTFNAPQFVNLRIKF